MFQGQQKFEEVLGLVQDWIPSKEYGHESKFQNELQEFLDESLNESGGGDLMGGMGQQQEDVVDRERGSSRADIAVNDQIGIEMKREFSNSQTKKLEGQIKSHLRNYDFIIVCACGIQDTSGWRDLKNKYEGNQGGLGATQQQVAFVWKKKENYGGSQQERGGGGDGVFDQPIF